ncbi:MAG: hypothetical protein ORN98_02210 [Alphaproteobacteria bacterium]|nr:hypothetical protein [Alphaproteobacteria bacterium]
MPEQPLPMIGVALLRQFRPSVKIVSAIFVLSISAVLAVEKLFLVEGLSEISDFFKEYQTWFGSVLAYVAVIVVGQPIVKIAKDVEQVKEDFQKNVTQQNYDGLEKIDIYYKDNFDISLSREEAELIAYKPGTKVILTEKGEFLPDQAPIGMAGRFIGIKLNNKTASEKRAVILDHSFDEIVTVTIYYDDERKKILTTFLEYQTMITESGDVILFRALLSSL